MIFFIIKIFYYEFQCFLFDNKNPYFNKYNFHQIEQTLKNKYTLKNPIIFEF